MAGQTPLKDASPSPLTHQRPLCCLLLVILGRFALSLAAVDLRAPACRDDCAPDRRSVTREEGANHDPDDTPTPPDRRSPAVFDPAPPRRLAAPHRTERGGAPLSPPT
uniref:Secreted protein n=1 Tax=Plectus sambesii TaxID=2011161 RepID=A0A914WIY1_9BILA